MNKSLTAFATTLCLIFTPARAADTPADSIYRLKPALTDQASMALGLDHYRGAPVLISMFFASCGYVCPTLIRRIQYYESQLEPAQRARLRVLLVSFDTEHDTPEVLASLAKKHGADLRRWSFTRASAADVRKLAAVLSIQYRELPDGGFNHASVITLLDPEGRVLARSERPGAEDAGLRAALEAATR